MTALLILSAIFAGTVLWAAEPATLPRLSDPVLTAEQVDEEGSNADCQR